MLLEPTLARLRTLRLDAMAKALQEQQGLPDIDEISFWTAWSTTPTASL